MAQDPISGRFVISFRDFLFTFNDNGVVTSAIANDFVAWVGTYDQLVLGQEGDYRIRLMKDFGELGVKRHGDNGYAGNQALPDGTFVIDTYGIFDPETPPGSGNKIMAVHFKLGEVECANGLVDKSVLVKLAEKFAGDQDKFNYLSAQAVRMDIQQVEVDRIVAQYQNE